MLVYRMVNSERNTGMYVTSSLLMLCFVILYTCNRDYNNYVLIILHSLWLSCIARLLFPFLFVVADKELSGLASLHIMRLT